MTKTNSELALELLGDGLSALLAERLEGARLLWIGRDAGLAPILEKAEHALQLDLASKRTEPLAVNHTRRGFREGRLRFRPGSFDLIVIPDLWDVPGDLLQLIEDVVEVGEGGLIALGVPYEGRAAYREFVELVDEAAEDARLYGAVDFAGVSFAELGLRDARVVVASSPEPRYPQYILALNGDLEGIPAAFIGEQRGLKVAREKSDDRSARTEALEGELARAKEAQREAERALKTLEEKFEERLEAERQSADKAAKAAEAIEAELEEAKKTIAELRPAAAERASRERELERELEKLRRVLDETDAEIADLREERAERALLFSRFEARGEEIVELRAELERRRILVRDAVEELRLLRRRGTGGSEEARQRVLESEYALEQLRLERDELKAALLEARASVREPEQAEEKGGEEAALNDRVEALEIALEESEREKGKLHDEIAKLAEERAGLNERIAGLTAAVEAAERAENEAEESAETHESSDAPAASSAELRSLIGERDGLRFRLLNTEAALSAERARRGFQNDAAEKLKERETELMETRVKLGSQELALETQSELMRKLQRDLAAAEKELRDIDAREEQLRAESERLRDALMTAIAERDELRDRQESAEGGDAAELREKYEALAREIEDLREELIAQEGDLVEARRRAEAAEAATDEARRSLEETREALLQLQKGGMN